MNETLYDLEQKMESGWAGYSSIIWNIAKGIKRTKTMWEILLSLISFLSKCFYLSIIILYSLLYLLFPTWIWNYTWSISKKKTVQNRITLWVFLRNHNHPSNAIVSEGLCHRRRTISRLHHYSNSERFCQPLLKHRAIFSSFNQ